MNRRLRRAMYPGLIALAGLIALSSGAAAQQAAGDSAWLAGDFHAARIAYERELAADPDSPRANFRLGILASWDGRLDSALVLIRRARAVEPRDPDLLVGEARVLAWAGRYDEAIRQYDSALVFSPGHHEALLGRATTLAWDNRLDEADSAYRVMLEADPTDTEAATGRALVLAWSGELGSAIRRYHAVLERDPDNVRALTGLAQAYQWQGRPHLARSYVSRAREADPTDRDARELERRVLATLRPRVELQAGFSDDSDDNLAYWQTGTLSSYLSEGLSGFLTVGALEASDPVRDATRLMVEGGASWAR
ncbi:MAG: tetratricopeptide repeat protein, partial [Gemmatimonadales bacterium]